MKKFTYILLMVFTLLLPLHTLASKVTFTEKENGVINTKLHFDSGFIGGLDFTFNLSDNIQVKDVQFSDNIKKYTTNFTFDENKHTLNIKVTTGGISQDYNLLNSKKELDLGNIYFTTKEKKNINYTLEIDSLTIIENDWSHKSIPKEELSINGNKSFNYIVNIKEENNEENKEDNNSSTTEEVITQEIPNDENNSTTNDNVNNETTNNNASTNKDKVDKEDVDNKEEDKQNSSQNPSNQNSSSKEKEEKNNTISNFLKVILVLIGIVSIIIIIVVLSKKKAKKETR